MSTSRNLMMPQIDSSSSSSSSSIELKQPERGRGGGGGRERGRRKIDISQFISVCAAGFIVGCATNPPPLPPHNPADPQVRASSKRPRNVLRRDEVTLAIEKELSATANLAKSAESMQHEMHDMPDMQHGKMQHEGMNMKGQDQMKPNVESEKTAAPIYTCPMHPQVRSDKPGKCPICGMTLEKKEANQ